MRRKHVRLATAMLRAGISGRELAATTQLHPATISGLLNLRKRPKPATVAAICRALGCRRSDIAWPEAAT